MSRFPNKILKSLLAASCLTLVGIVSVACLNEVPADSAGGLSAQPVARHVEPTQPVAGTPILGQSDLETPSNSALSAAKNAQIPPESESVVREDVLDQPTESNPPVDSSITAEAHPESGDTPTMAAPALAPTEKPTSLPASDPEVQQPTPTPEPVAVQSNLKSTRQVDIDLDQFRQMIPRDQIKPIYEPKFVSADRSSLQANELVIGVEIDGESRAYPIGPLNEREMVNDTVGGIPILVSW